VLTPGVGLAVSLCSRPESGWRFVRMARAAGAVDGPDGASESVAGAAAAAGPRASVAIPRPFNEFPSEAYPEPKCTTQEIQAIVDRITMTQRWMVHPPGAPIAMRFRHVQLPPDTKLEGALLWDVTDAIYLGEAGQTVPMWRDMEAGEDGVVNFKELAQRDVTNPRVRGSTILRYSQRFLHEGWFPSLRGSLECRYSATDTEVGCYTAGGSVTKGFLLARRSDPQNAYVQRMGRDGCPGVNILHRQTPDDVARFRKLKSNQFHEKGGVNCIEMLDDQPDVSAQWHAHCDEHRIKANLCPNRGEFTWAKQQERFITLNYSDLFGSSGTITTWTVVQSFRGLLDGMHAYPFSGNSTICTRRTQRVANSPLRCCETARTS
jgi:hypothetical protein